MSEIRISEVGTVQFSLVNPSVGFGWTPITPDVAKQKRRVGIGRGVKVRSQPKTDASRRTGSAYPTARHLAAVEQYTFSAAQ